MGLLKKILSFFRPTSISVENSDGVVTGDIKSGGGDVKVGGIHINLKEAADYIALLAQETELKERFAQTQQRKEKYPDGDFDVELFKISEALNTVKKQIEILKTEVQKLAEEFGKIQINTDRLKAAKKHFDTGEFKEARAVLDSEKMEAELDAILYDKVRFQKALEKNEQLLTDKANEFLILARLTAIDFDLKEMRFEKAKKYFERSLVAHKFLGNLSAFAEFLWDNYQLKDAEFYYEEVLMLVTQLNSLESDELLKAKAIALCNLATIWKESKLFVKAQKGYINSLNVYKQLQEQSKEDFFSQIGFALNNLGIASTEAKDYLNAQNAFGQALMIRRKLANKDPNNYLPYVAQTFHDMGVMWFDLKDFEAAEEAFIAALEIRKKLAIEKEGTYLSEVAQSLNSVGVLRQNTGNLNEAEAMFIEAFEIRKKLAIQNPEGFLIKLAMSASNMCIFYTNFLPNKEKAEFYARETIFAAIPFLGSLAYIKDYVQGALNMIFNWGMDPDVFFEKALHEHNSRQQTSPTG